MTIALFTADSIPIGDVAASLMDEGIDIRPFDLHSLRSTEPLGQDIKKAVLIVSRHGAGEATALVSGLLTKERKLILCTRTPDNEGYDLLKELGAAAIITPRTWDAENISERILAQLILDGDVQPSTCGNLYGATKAMHTLYSDIAIFAPLSDPVLILGETGTGKELVAREVHNKSGRPDQFIAINCGVLSFDLAGSDLFGHKKGSFTGATESRKGLLADAGEGTILLDEIGELDLKAQAVLLRVLEEKKVRRLGSNQTEDVPARIVLATNRDLEFECEEGRFRQDLFERIRGFMLELKPLRERKADIPLLVLHFLAEFNKENKRKVQLPENALDCLFNSDWLGNIRELRYAVRVAAAYAHPEGFISGEHFSRMTVRERVRKHKREPGSAKYYAAFDPTVDTWKDFLKRAEAVYFEAVLEAAKGNKKEAARRSGLSLSQFYEKLKPDD